MADKNNKNNQDRTQNGQDTGQAGQDIPQLDGICSKELKKILDKIHKQYGRALRRLAGWDKI